MECHLSCGGSGNEAELELFQFAAAKQPLRFWRQETAGGHMAPHSRRHSRTPTSRRSLRRTVGIPVEVWGRSAQCVRRLGHPLGGRIDGG